jgi:hopanoid biosynthesis associated protein HpnK
MRRLIVTADDFGGSPEINKAVIKAHLEGILTTASLMINEPGADEAIELAHRHPTLGVGLHLVLCKGKSALPHEKAPKLVKRTGFFEDSPLRAGLKYFFDRAIKSDLKKEIELQIRKFRGTGIPLDHISGHLNIHMHPVVLDILLDLHKIYLFPAIRLTYDPFGLGLKLDRRNLFYKITHAMIFSFLSRRNRLLLIKARLPHADRVFGLLQTNYIDKQYVLKLLTHLPKGTSELYVHPGQQDSDLEMEALLSQDVKQVIRTNQIKLIRYRDLQGS